MRTSDAVGYISRVPDDRLETAEALAQHGLVGVPLDVAVGGSVGADGGRIEPEDALIELVDVDGDLAAVEVVGRSKGVGLRPRSGR